MTFKQQMADDLDLFYNTDEFAEAVTIESADGDDVYHDIAVIFDFGDGFAYRGADDPGVEGWARIRLSDLGAIKTGYIIYRDEERWRLLGGAVQSTDGLEWIVPISRFTE
jgi:hypothetical protein